MSTSDDNETAVTYTVKELLARIEEKLVRIDTRSQDYATKNDIHTVSVRNEEQFKQTKGEIHAVTTRNDAQFKEISKEIDELKSLKERLLGFIIAIVVIGALSGGTAGYLINIVK